MPHELTSTPQVDHRPARRAHRGGRLPFRRLSRRGGGPRRFADALGDAVREPVRHAGDARNDLRSRLAHKAARHRPALALLVERGESDSTRRSPSTSPEFERGRQARDHRPPPADAHFRPAGVATALPFTDGDRESACWKPSPRSRSNMRRATRVVYSDLGFITLGLLLEHVTGAPLDRARATRHLRAARARSAPSSTPRALCRPAWPPANRAGNAYERGMCETTTARRGCAAGGGASGLIWGEVHDGNAYFLGGAAGHAGLFSNARETLRLAEQFLASARPPCSPPTPAALFRTNMTRGLNEARSFAWQLAATPDSTAGPRSRPTASATSASPARVAGSTRRANASLSFSPTARTRARSPSSTSTASAGAFTRSPSKRWRRHERVNERHSGRRRARSARRFASGSSSASSRSAARRGRSPSCTASWSSAGAGSARSVSCTRSTTACCCPAPRRQQLAIYIGWLMHRTLGRHRRGRVLRHPLDLHPARALLRLRRVRQHDFRGRGCSRASSRSSSPSSSRP